MTSTTPARRPSKLLDGLKVETLNTLGLREFAGVLLESTPRTMPVSVAFTGIAYLRRLAFHRRRVLRELARTKILERAKTRGVYRDVKNPRLPRGVKRDDLKLVNCARCSRNLLGESQEPIREARANSRHVANLPPPVAARLHGGRPYCATCAAFFDPPK